MYGPLTDFFYGKPPYPDRKTTPPCIECSLTIGGLAALVVAIGIVYVFSNQTSVPPGHILVSLFGLENLHEKYQHSLSILQSKKVLGGAVSAFDLIGAFLIFFIPFAFAGTAWAAWTIGVENIEVHIEGPRFDDSEHAPQKLAEAFKKESQHPGGAGLGVTLGATLIKIPRARETRHFLILGGSGAGKTTVLFPTVLSSTRAGDKVLIHDFKGDFTQKIPSEIYILAPWDARSISIDIAKDCRNEDEAQEFAAALIPVHDGANSVFSKAARDVLSGAVISLQKTKGTNWTWRDLDSLISNENALESALSNYWPHAINSMAQERTRASVLMDLRASAGVQIQRLATKSANNLFSVRDWLTNQKNKTPLVIKSSGALPDFSSSILKMILSIVHKTITSWPDAPPDGPRRVWLFLDEFGQIGKTKSMKSILEVGRSKNVRVVIAAQSTRQLQAESFQDQDARILFKQNIATTIYLQLPETNEAAEAARACGKSRVSRANYTQNQGEKGGGSYSRIQEERDCIPPHVFQALGPKKDGVEAIVTIGDGVARKILFPFFNLPDRRAGDIPAPAPAPTEPSGWGF